MSTHILVPLPEDAPIPAESLAATDLGDGRYRLESAPFVAYDLCRGDVVRCTRDDEGRPVVDSIVEQAGAHTIRLLLDAELDLMAKMKALLALRELGCIAEDPKGRYYALTAGPDVDLEAVLDTLDAQAEAGLHEFEVFGASTAG